MKMRRVWGRMDLVRRQVGMLALGLVGVGLLNRQNCDRYARSYAYGYPRLPGPAEVPLALP
jgi:hypothetical protein